MKINFKNLATVILFLLSHSMSSQKVDSIETIEKLKKEIKEFFIQKGEISKENNLGIGAYEITDGSDLGNKKIGIYIVRTEYRTDGEDYLFFKNDKDYTINDFTDLKLIINQTLTLLNEKSDKEIFDYIKAINKWYEESYLHKKNHKKLKFVSGKKG